MGIGWALDRADVNDIREAGWKKDASNDFEYVPMNRLQEYQVKRGVARQEQLQAAREN